MIDKTVEKIQNKIENMLIEENLDDLDINWACYQMDGELQNEQVIIVRLGEEY
tara:strand:- start:2220 stop:2378 length:159 start_codon:yes stop_codon:yes gene_type:complete